MAKQNNNSSFKELSTTIREKFPNLLLGILVLIVVVVLLFSYSHKNSLQKMNKPKTNYQQTELYKPVLKKYIVKQGDYLWRIAEEAYGSGFNAYDIAKANQIVNPDIIQPGQQLVLPSVIPRQSTTGEIGTGATSEKVISHPSTYTVRKGDYLWKLAIDFYGDGYAWVPIARANHLTNPNLIFSGNKLTLP